MQRENYFDHASTTFLDPEVREVMLPWLGEWTGNSESMHQWGAQANAAVEWAREQVAMAMGAEDPAQIIFTSGATEANNAAVRQYHAEMAISPFEHSSLREIASHYGVPVLENVGYTLNGQPERIQVVMGVSNETGAILDTPGGDRRFCDLTQAVGKVPFHLDQLVGASLSAHKLGGPMGVGVLYLRDPVAFAPWQWGGGHEFGLRSGTLPVAGIVGMGRAISLAVQRREELAQHCLSLKNVFWDELQALRGWTTDPEWLHSPAILSITLPRITAATLVLELDAAGYAASAGAACSSREVEPSPGLLAFGYSSEQALATLRVSFGWSNTVDSTAQLARQMVRLVENYQN